MPLEMGLMSVTVSRVGGPVCEGFPQNRKVILPGEMVHTCHPSTWRLGQENHKVQCQPEQLTGTLFQKLKEKGRKKGRKVQLKLKA